MKIIKKKINKDLLKKTIMNLLDAKPVPDDDCFEIIIELLQKRKEIFDVYEKSESQSKKYVSMDESLKKRILCYITENTKAQIFASLKKTGRNK